jgi:hypothetical protein
MPERVDAVGRLLYRNETPTLSATDCRGDDTPRYCRERSALAHPQCGVPVIRPIAAGRQALDLDPGGAPAPTGLT